MKKTKKNFVRRHSDSSNTTETEVLFLDTSESDVNIEDLDYYSDDLEVPQPNPFGRKRLWLRTSILECCLLCGTLTQK